MARILSCVGFACCAVAAALSAACGGTVVSGPAAGGGSAGGGEAAGGASGSVAAGAAGTSCVFQGKTYADGVSFPASDGCNTCSCQAGLAICTLLGCSTGCQSNGQSYQPGQTFKIDCNTCTCQADGIVCTRLACQGKCMALQDQYADALKRAKACDPTAQAEQCSGEISGTPSCGCPTPVNASNAKALSELAALSMQAGSLCSSPCPPCVAPGPAICSAAGSCESAPLRAGETACKVGGIVYPSGETRIPDPRSSCNSCECEDGQLGCTQKACSTPDISCPSGTEYGTQCAQCGPTDACQITEFACLPTCTDLCMNGFCSNGLCRQICG